MKIILIWIFTVSALLLVSALFLHSFDTTYDSIPGIVVIFVITASALFIGLIADNMQYKGWRFKKSKRDKITFER